MNEKVKRVIYLLLLLLLIVPAWFVTRQHSQTLSDGRFTQIGGVARQDFNRKVRVLKYTRHARCRMACRRITEAEVKDILQHGSVNYRRSDVNDRPCPTYALEGYTQQDRQHVRIIFAQCRQETRVVTCIDLDEDFTCHCN